jgi:ribosomal protein S18 acetylase RimI-like enzyme
MSQTVQLPIRSASLADNPGLLALAAEVPVVTPAFAYTLERSPDYFAFAQAQASHFDIRVAGEPGTPIQGFLSVTFDRVWLAGQALDIAYTADLRVAQSARGLGLGDRLMREGIRVAGQSNPLPVFTCVMKDNPVGLKMNANLARDGITEMKTVGEMTLHLLLPFKIPRRSFGHYQISRAQMQDLPEMHALWLRVKSKQHLARAWSYTEWAAWIAATPGLQVSDYLLARDRQGRLSGFFAVWNQQALRRVRLKRVNPLLQGLQTILRPLSAPLNWPALPATGQVLPIRQMLNLCIDGPCSDAFPALLQVALTALRAEKAFFLGLALDQRDPLGHWLSLFSASRSDLYLLSNYAFARPERGLFHLEIGLG